MPEKAITSPKPTDLPDSLVAPTAALGAAAGSTGLAGSEVEGTAADKGSSAWVEGCGRWGGGRSQNRSPTGGREPWGSRGLTGEKAYTLSTQDVPETADNPVARQFHHASLPQGTAFKLKGWRCVAAPALTLLVLLGGAHHEAARAQGGLRHGGGAARHGGACDRAAGHCDGLGQHHVGRKR
eukprot:366104-Chlamydomonas_euryale.AAC.15